MTLFDVLIAVAVASAEDFAEPDEFVVVYIRKGFIALGVLRAR